MDRALDNPVWHALTGPHQSLSIGNGAACHYPREIVPFSAIARPTAEAYVDLARDLPTNVEARLFRPGEEPLPAGWQKIDAFPILQMVAETSERPVASDAPAFVLSEADVDCMMELASATEPGPFGPRALALGTYLGIRDGDRLVVMAGERMRVRGFVELSGICTHPDVRGRGYASQLTRRLMRAASDRGERPFLHVRPENAAALRLYQALGFRLRRELVVVWCRPFPK
jgi:predicted GNAT family acetyltransferase